jgi:hypothetical protein
MVKLIRKWIEKIRVALWLHPEFDLSKRAVLLGSAALVASLALYQPILGGGAGIVADARPLFEKLLSVTRRELVPYLFVQIYAAQPALRVLLEG